MPAPPALSLGAALNQVQQTSATAVHQKLAKLLAPAKRAEPEAFAAELLGLLRHAFCVPKARPGVAGGRPAR